MAEYTAIFTKPYADGYEDLPSQNTPITAQTLNDKDAVIEHIEDYLSTNDIPTYDEKTSTSGEFKTLSGGIMGSCVINLSLVQSGSGTPSPQNVRPITGHSSVEVDVTDADSNTTQYTVALGQTVYGGSVDVVSGVLTVDRLYAELDGSSDEGWSVDGTGTDNYFFVTGNVLDSLMTQTPNPIFNKGVYATIYSSNTTQGIYITGRKVRYRQGAEVSLSDFKTSLSNEPLQICYYISTPTTIQLTPQQIETLIGQNNVSVPLDGQSLDSLTYREVLAWDDVETAIDSATATKADISAIGTDESGRTTASRSYAQNEFFYKDGKFGKTKTAVAQGATWTLNTNYEETSIASEQRVQEESATIPSAMSSYVTINRQTIVRCGLVVSVAMQITVNNMPSGGVILNMPFANQGTAKFFGIYGGSSFSPTGTGVYISSDSSEVRCASAIPNGQHWISGTYIMKTY